MTRSLGTLVLVGAVLFGLSACSDSPLITRTLDLKRQPREVKGKCLGGAPTALPAGANRISRARGDFDGDGLTERFLVYDPTTGPMEPVPDEPESKLDFGPWRFRMELATGAITDEDFSAEGGGRPLGAPDVNGDGRDEVLIWTTGGSGGALTGEVITLDGCRVVEATFVDTPNVAFEFTVFGSPSGPAMGGFVCMNADGDPATESVETDSREDTNGDGEQDSFQEHDSANSGPRTKQWRVTIYELKGSAMVLEHELHGDFGSARPDRFPFGDDVTCDGVKGT